MGPLETCARGALGLALHSHLPTAAERNVSQLTASPESVVAPRAPMVSANTPSAGPRRWIGGLPALALAAGSNLLLLAPLPLELRFAGAFVLFVALPGYLFVEAVFGRRRSNLLERRVLGRAVATS